LADTEGMDMSADIIVRNHGSIVLLEPQDRAAEEWLETNVEAEAQWWGPSLVVEPRYVEDIVEGARADGLEVR